MKRLVTIIFILTFINTVSAADIKDVKILDTKPSKSGIEVKMQLKDGPEDSYFFVDIVKTDHDSFNKMALVMEKLKKGNSVKLNLKIPSFSASPSGSYYKSSYVKFSKSKGKDE